MIEIVHQGVCPQCKKVCSQLSWQGKDPNEIPEFAKFSTPVLYCCGWPFEATGVRLLYNGGLIAEQLFEAA